MQYFGWSPPVRQLPRPPVPFYNPLVTVPNAPITIDIIDTFMFHFFFQFRSKVEVLTVLFPFCQLYSVVSWDSRVLWFTGIAKSKQEWFKPCKSLQNKIGVWLNKIRWSKFEVRVFLFPLLFSMQKITVFQTIYAYGKERVECILIPRALPQSGT